MELYAKGQLSFLMLTCLQERDFYGLDIISEISNRSNGRINLKKPSVYSNLTRMEKQKYITSYMQSSDFGPNRKYYSLTESGRKFYQELKEYFDRNNIDVFRDFVDSDSPAVVEEQPKFEDKTVETKMQTTETTDDFFDFSSLEADEEKEEDVEEDAVEEKPTNDFKFLKKAPEEVLQPKSTEIKAEDDSPVERENEKVDNVSIEEYNKRLYDISKDINKFKRKRSFAEDQIAMQTTAPLVDSQEKNKANLEEFKHSFLENKNKYSTESFTTLDFSRYAKNNKTIIEEKPAVKEEIKNDAVFITKRYNVEDLEKPKRIEPPRLRIVETDVDAKESKLPAPKRDKSIDPSHKDILTKLYSKTKDNSAQEVREDALYDYDDLKEYYNKQSIAFSEYKKTSHKVEHNTTKLYFIASIIAFLCAVACSGIIYGVLAGVNMLNPNTNFMFILLPALLLIDVIWKFVNFKRLKASMPTQILPQWQIWALYLIIAGLIVCLNFICGLSTQTFAMFATTITLPLIVGIIVFPVYYYIRRYLIIKHWK